MHSRFGAYRLMVKTITMTALLFLAGVGAVLWLMPYEWLWIVLPAVTLLLCAVSVALYWYEVRLPIGRMIASMQAMREGQAVTLDDARRDDEFGQLARAIVEFSIRNQHHWQCAAGRTTSSGCSTWSPAAFPCRTANTASCAGTQLRRPVRSAAGQHLLRGLQRTDHPAPNARSSAHGRKGPSSKSGKPRQPRRDAGLLVRADRAPVRQGRQRPRLWK
ncbi:MAG: hypothetical protein ACLT2T_04005 [Bilophila wadsworthia]